MAQSMEKVEEIKSNLENESLVFANLLQLTAYYRNQVLLQREKKDLVKDAKEEVSKLCLQLANWYTSVL